MGQESLELISLDLPRNNNRESVGLCPKPPGQVPSDVLVNSVINQWKNCYGGSWGSYRFPYETLVKTNGNCPRATFAVASVFFMKYFIKFNGN